MSTTDDSGAFEVTTDLSGSGSEAVVVVSGELDSHSAPTFDDALDRLPGTVEKIVVDLSRVGFIDSSGLRVLIKARKRLGDAEGALQLRSPSSSTVRLLDITGLSEHFPVC